MTTDRLEFGKLTFRNFLSFGNNPEIIDLSGDWITAILGQNNDTGGEDSRNGVGKSAIIDALCYALYGRVIRKVTIQKLVNKLARKGQSMLVTLEFTKGDYRYLVERGEKPSLFNFFRKPIDSTEDFREKDEEGKLKYDIVQGKGKAETNQVLLDVISFDIKIFEIIIGNSSESIAFPMLEDGDQRDIMERLMGFDLMTKIADSRAKERTSLNKKVVSLNSSINATVQANNRIQSEIKTMESRATSWEDQKRRTIDSLKEQINILENVDASAEIETLNLLKEVETIVKDISTRQFQANMTVRDANRALSDQTQKETRHRNDLSRMSADLEKIHASTCPTCNQFWEADASIRENLETQIANIEQNIADLLSTKPELEKAIEEAQAALTEINAELSEAKASKSELEQIDLHYRSIEEAAAADATLQQLRQQLSEKDTEENPHLDSIEGLKQKAIQAVDTTELDETKKLVEHYDLLIKLLTSNDSYIRKAILDMWLPMLNSRIAHYLKHLELPHRVKFLSDMSLQITNYNAEFDWGSLSKGQRVRVIIALNFAFQDIFEYNKFPVNTLMVDELIDSGLCSRGASNVVSILNEISKTKNKRVFLITHRDDIVSQIDDSIKVVMDNNISHIED